MSFEASGEWLHDGQEGYVITLEDVSKLYSGQTKPALRHIDLQIDKGEFVFLRNTIFHDV